MNIEAELSKLTTKAAKIRFLAQQGWERSDIARELDIRYQQVRNTLGSKNITKSSTIQPSPLIEKLGKIAEAEGVSPQALLDEALGDFIEKKRRGSPRPHVMAAYEESVKAYDALYRQLAK